MTAFHSLGAVMAVKKGKDKRKPTMKMIGNKKNVGMGRWQSVGYELSSASEVAGKVEVFGC